MKSPLSYARFTALAAEGIIVDMRDEDETFAEIVSKEFDEHLTGATPMPSEEPTTATPDDFHLNLFDDDESYRHVSYTQTLSRPTIIGLAFLCLGALISVGRFAHLGLPNWAGWVGVGSFILGVAIIVWHVTSSAPTDRDEPVV